MLEGFPALSKSYAQASPLLSSDRAQSPEIDRSKTFRINAKEIARIRRKTKSKIDTGLEAKASHKIAVKSKLQNDFNAESLDRAEFNFERGWEVEEDPAIDPLQHLDVDKHDLPSINALQIVPIGSKGKRYKFRRVQ